jgi:hypothetical protein
MGVRAAWRALFAANPALSGDTRKVRLSESLLRGRGASGSISREEALTIPGVLRGRNMICSISTLPLEVIDRQNRLVDHPLMRQVDSNVANIVTIAQTVEDLLFDSIAWWRITSFEFIGDDFSQLVPASAERVDPSKVHFVEPLNARRSASYLPSGSPTHGTIWMDGEEVPYWEVIRFDSPNPPLLEVASRSIRRAIALDEAAEMYANDPRPMDYFTPSDTNVDPVDDDEVEEILEKWAASRKKRSTAYVPAALKYNEVQQPTPADLQLVQLQQRVGLDIANALGLDPEDLGISTTSRTYQNDTARRQDRINDLLSTYMGAITGRLNMPDVTPPQDITRFGLDNYLRADPKTRAEVNSIYLAAKVITPKWVAQTEGLPPEAMPAPEPEQPVVRPAIPATVGQPIQQDQTQEITA